MYIDNFCLISNTIVTLNILKILLNKDYKIKKFKKNENYYWKANYQKSSNKYNKNWLINIFKA